jgi:TP901 family phage tail tape measure protein
MATRSLQQLQNDIRQAAQGATHFRTELERLDQVITSIGPGTNVNEIERALRRAGTTGESTFTKLSKGASDTLMQMNRLTQAFNALVAAERNAALAAAVPNAPGAGGQPLSPMQRALAGLNQGIQKPVIPANVLGRAQVATDVFTRGTVTPLSPGIMGEPMQIRRAIDSARTGVQQFAREIQQAYGGAVKMSDHFSTSIDQATGKLIYQTEIIRQLGNKVQQRIPVTQTVDPQTMQRSSYSPSQQAFIDQAGGIQRANQMLAQYGVTVNNVTGYYKDLNSNTARFSVTAADGLSESMGAMDQFGNATLHASRNAQTLLQNITRNITKVLEWAAATSVVYAVMNSLMRAAGELDDIDETMADIAISTGAAGEELQKYYESALDVANLTGVDVTDTLEAQSKAYRAASDSTDRFRTANRLLTDSLILARLSGMQQAESLDTLVAALRQSGMSLEQGTSLLDKWVKTSQNAGVSIQDLAQSFAITSDVASTVGVSVDELNGLISVLAEKTILSSTEIGNALRTMFANITSDEAVKTLGEMGIAVEDVNGNMRDWLDINQNIVDLINSGALSDEQVNRLANALGGGSRRGPQLIALWSNFGRVADIAADSMDANGEAAAAMGAKLDTLKSAANEFNNAFNELVQTLGYEGGFLELMIDGTKLATEFVNSLNDMAESFDGAASSIAIAVTALIGLQRIAGNINWSSIMASPGGTNVIGFPTSKPGPLTGMANALGRQYGPGWQSGLQGFMPGAAVSAGEIYRGINEGDSAGQISARVAATMAGAFVGNMILPGAGGLIGSVIADSFVNTVQTRQEVFRTISTGELSGKSSSEIQDVIEQSFGSWMLGPKARISGAASKEFSDDEMLDLLLRAEQTGAFRQIRDNRTWSAFGPRNAQNDEFLANAGFNESESGLLKSLVSGYGVEEAELVLEALREYRIALEREAGVHEEIANSMPSASALRIGEFINGGQGQALGANFRGQRDALIASSSITGDSDQLTRVASNMELVAVSTAAVATALKGASDETERYVEIGNILLNATDAERERIILLTSQINELVDARAEGRGGIDRSIQEEVRLRTELEKTIALSERAAAIREAREKYIGFSKGPEDAQGNLVSANSVNFYGLLDQARQMQTEYAEYLGIDADALEASVTDPLVLAFSDGYHTVEGLTSDFSNWFVEQMKAAAEEGSEALAFTFRDMRDVSPATFEQIKKRAKYYENFLTKEYGPSGYNEQTQNIGVLLEGNQAKTLNTTMTALNLAIEELTEVEKKQLEGVWNLPAGMTAYVPITSLFYNQQQGNDPSAELMNQAANTQTNAANTMERAANMMAYASANAAEGALMAARRASAKDYGNNMPYASSNAAEGSIRVNVEPQSVSVQISGREVANSVAKFSATVAQDLARARGRSTQVAR